MESGLDHQYREVRQLLLQIEELSELIVQWNADIYSVNDYVTTPEGLKTLAATCMHLESIGEAIKKIDKIIPHFLEENSKQIPWKSIKGMRDHIAHGYFEIDADIVYDVVSSEIENLLVSIRKLIILINDLLHKK
ncbi:MAG: DUF86 domain-containing protein [Muribaculaceae bacterium]|nr:DUF86 domain-containing protein [Muribaculaceae bacterium]